MVPSARRRRDSALARGVQPLVSLLLLALVAVGVVRAMRGASSATHTPLTQPDLSSLLAHGHLPFAFSCGGLTWHAAGAGPVEDEFRLVPVTPALGAYDVFRFRGGASRPPRLYIPVARRGPLAGVYVWYEPAATDPAGSE